MGDSPLAGAATRVTAGEVEVRPVTVALIVVELAAGKDETVAAAKAQSEE